MPSGLVPGAFGQQRLGLVDERYVLNCRCVGRKTNSPPSRHFGKLLQVATHRDPEGFAVRIQLVGRQTERDQTRTHGCKRHVVQDFGVENLEIMRIKLGRGASKVRDIELDDQLIHTAARFDGIG